MGRAGAGGYATVQHAWDTRLKRHVAIKCIKISQSDIARAAKSRSATKAEPLFGRVEPIEPASAPQFPVPGQKRAKAAEDAPVAGGPIIPEQPGFVPLTTKISEPTFFDSREKQAERRAHRRDILREGGREAAARVPFDAEFGASPEGRAGHYRATGRGEGVSTGETFDIEAFAGYSNFKGKSQHRRTLSQQEISEHSFGLADFAAHLPGQIHGAGQAEIGGIGEEPIHFASTKIIRPEASSVSPFSAPTNNAESANAASNQAGSPNSLDQATEPFRPLQPLAPLEQLPPFPQPQPAADPLAAVDRIPGLEEARTAAHLNDANIVTVYDCVVQGNMAYVIMEYVEGKTLARIMRDLGNDITLDMIASIFASVSHALEVAHKANVLHLDIKPENVIISNDGIIKVTDFGLSTLMDATGCGQTGGGTIGYMPLEQMRQQRLDVRTDEWALASLTYEMLSGKNPFKARTLQDAEAAIEGAELVIPSLCWESIDASVDDIMFDALCPEMKGRYPTISEFRDELLPLLGDAREGTKQLEQAMKNVDLLLDDEAQEQMPREQRVYVPFIDRLGVGGSNILMRIFSAISVALIAAIAMINFRVPITPDGLVTETSQLTGLATFGLFGSVPIGAWVALAVFIAIGALLPRFGMLLAYVALSVMLFYNQAWILGLLVLLGACAWWWLYGRQSDIMCSLVMLQPLFGSFGFSAIAPVITGAVLDIRQALAATGMIILSSVAFASFGSADVSNWDVARDFIVAINPEIAGNTMAESFIATMTSPQNWCMFAGWVLGALVYSLFCRKGTHAFDVLGSFMCAAFIVAGGIAYPLLSGNMEMLSPILICGTAVSAIVGIVFALLNIPDRVRMAPGEW